MRSAPSSLVLSVIFMVHLDGGLCQSSVTNETSNGGPHWNSTQYTHDPPSFSGKHVLAGVAAFILALAASSFGWLGNLMRHRYIISATSGALIVCGYSLASHSDVSSALLFGSMIAAFGTGSVFSTIPAYAFDSKTAFMQRIVSMMSTPVVGGIAMQNLAKIINKSYPTNFIIGIHIALSLIFGLLPKILEGLSWSNRTPLDTDSPEKPAQGLRDTDVDFKLNDGESPTNGQIHPFDYYYKPGMKLRPAPARAKASPAWKPLRQRLLSPHMDVRDEPRRTERVKKLEDHLWQGDELMDDVITLGHRIGLRVVRKMVTTALSDGIQALPNPPIEIVNLFEQLDRTPEWFNADEFEHGRIVYSDATYIGTIGALMLNKTITSQAESVASAVNATGQYTSKSKKTQIRRNTETTHFFGRVPRPGGWKRYSETFQEVVKVRFMHCQVRYLLKKRWGAEHFNRYGVPISNTDMSLGIVAFGVSRLICDGVFGIRHSTEDLDSVVRFWAYIGYIFGVDEEIIPQTFEEAVQLYDYLLSSHGTPSPYGDAIAKSLDMFETELLRGGKGPIRKVLGTLNEIFQHGLTYFLCGDVLGSRMVAGSRGYLRMLSLTSAVVGKLAVSIIALKEIFPGRMKRMEARAIKGDPFDNYLDEVSNDVMRRFDLVPTFDAHDNHSINDFKKN